MKFIRLSVLTVSPDSWDKTCSGSEWEHDTYQSKSRYYRKVRSPSLYVLVLSSTFGSTILTFTDVSALQSPSR
jgi:hypothetical protein